MLTLNVVKEHEISFERTKTDYESITDSNSAYKVLSQIWDPGSLEYREKFIVVALDNQKHVMGYNVVSIGGSNSTVVEPAMVLRYAILSNANSIILAHNHPSGRLEASAADIHLTKRIKELCGILGVPALDHIIVTKDGYLSMADEGYM